MAPPLHTPGTASKQSPRHPPRSLPPAKLTEWRSTIWLVEHLKKWAAVRGYKIAIPRAEDTAWTADGTSDVILIGQVLKTLSDRNRSIDQQRIWVLSSATRRALCTCLEIPESWIGVVPRYELLAPSHSRRSRSLKSHSLVYSGRFARSKNFPLFLHFASLYQKHYDNDARIILMGGFPYPTSSEEMGLIAQCIETLPWTRRPEPYLGLGLHDWYREPLENPMLVQLSTGSWEDFGVSVAQAQAAGWPLILSNWGAHRDVRGTNVRLLDLKRADCRADLSMHKLRNTAHRLIEQVQNNPQRRNSNWIPTALTTSELISQRQFSLMQKRARRYRLGDPHLVKWRNAMWNDHAEN